MSCRVLLVLCLLCPALAPSLHADDASKRVKVHELFTLLHLDTLMQQMMTQAMDTSQQVVTGVFGQQKMTDADRALADKYIAQVKSICMESLGWSTLEPDYTNLYVETYSEEEIDGMLAFYRSPVGQSMLNKTPELTRRSTALVQSRLPALQEKVRAANEAFQAELAKSHKSQPPAKPGF